MLFADGIVLVDETTKVMLNQKLGRSIGGKKIQDQHQLNGEYEI